MGREDKRQRERVIKQLETKLGRAPTAEEIEAALDDLKESVRKRGDRPRRR